MVTEDVKWKGLALGKNGETFFLKNGTPWYYAIKNFMGRYAQNLRRPP